MDEKSEKQTLWEKATFHKCFIIMENIYPWPTAANAEIVVSGIRISLNILFEYLLDHIVSTSFVKWKWVPVKKSLLILVSLTLIL